MNYYIIIARLDYYTHKNAFTISSHPGYHTMLTWLPTLALPLSSLTLTDVWFLEDDTGAKSHAELFLMNG